MDRIIEATMMHLNEPIIFHLSVVRLVGYGMTQDDNYYIAHSTDKKRPIERFSAVAGFVSLKFLENQGVVISNNGEKWSDFTRLNSWLELNGAPKVENMIIESTINEKHTS